MTDLAPAAAKSRRRARPPKPVPESGWCPLAGCQRPWALHAMTEARHHRRLVAAGLELPPTDDDEPVEQRASWSGGRR